MIRRIIQESAEWNLPSIWRSDFNLKSDLVSGLVELAACMHCRVFVVVVLLLVGVLVVVSIVSSTVY